MRRRSRWADVVLVIAQLGCQRQPPDAPRDAAAEAMVNAAPAAGAASEELGAACDVLGAARCDATEAVGWGYIETRFGTRPRCVERLSLLCRHEARAPHSGMTPEAVRKCAAETLPDDSPDDCEIHGDLPNGRTCMLAAQCASANCVIPRGARCGICGDPRPVTHGWPCQNDRCGRGFECVDGKCLARLPLGARCAEGLKSIDSVGCQRGASCDNGRCVPLAVKVAHERAKEPPAKLRAEGQPCQYSDDCGGGTWCSEGHCVRDPDIGESCDGDHDSCLLPARCVRGKCALPSYDRCD